MTISEVRRFCLAVVDAMGLSSVAFLIRLGWFTYRPRSFVVAWIASVGITAIVTMWVAHKCALSIDDQPDGRYPEFDEIDTRCP
jgi:hypothetical protein